MTTRSAALASITLLLPALAPAPAPTRADDGWRYVLPAPGDPSEHPPLRALATSAARPVDVIERAAYRGARRRYAQVRFGEPNSTRVAVVLDESPAGVLDLYVDADRDRRIDARDRVEPGLDRRTWRLPLKVEAGPGEGAAGPADVRDRAVVFRLGATGLTLGFAAAGYLEGRVAVAGRSHAARRSDGDGNGLMADPQDKLWVDLDDDGRWDPTAEQFPFAPVLAIGGGRYAARSDPIGRRLALAGLEGEGTVRLAMDKAPSGGSVVAMTALLVGRDGSAVSLDGEGPATVPAGEYRLAAAGVVVRATSGSRWSFAFSDRGRRGEAAWHPVAKGGRVDLDPIGTMELRTGLEAGAAARPGAPIDAQPALYTGDGLLVVAVGRAGESAGEEGPTAEVALRSGDGPPLSSARCGFL